MEERFTVVVSSADLDGVVAGALAGRAVSGRAEALVFDSERLAEFFQASVQAKLPRGYDLAFCGLHVVHTDWDGQLVRPHLMDALRHFMGPVRWYAGGTWNAEDAGAVGHLIGADNLIVPGPGGTAAGAVRDRLFGPGDGYEDGLARLVAGKLADNEERRWGQTLRKVLTALKRDYYELANAVGALMDGRSQDLVDAYGPAAAQLEQENRDLARAVAEPLRTMGGARLVVLALPGQKHAFWAEISAYAREETQAELSLCFLQGRPVVLLGQSPGSRARLRAWVRYVTDLLPAAEALVEEAGHVPLLIRGLDRDPSLKDVLLGLMADGAHLLRS
jgi:hypothetical protein